MFLSIDRGEEEVRGSGGSSDEETLSPAMQVGLCFILKFCVYVQYLTLGNLIFIPAFLYCRLRIFFGLHSLTCNVHVVLKCIFMLVW